MFITSECTKGPTCPLNFSSLCHHETLPLNFHLIFVAGSAGVFIDPWAARVWVEVLTAVGNRSVLCFIWITVVTHDTASRITHGFSFGHDLVEHLRPNLPNWLHFLMACHAARRSSLRKVIDKTIRSIGLGTGE